MRTAEHLRYLILAAQREGNRQLTAALSLIGLTPAQSEALRIIADHGPLALKQLGDMLVCDSGTSPSRIVDRLVTAGLVQREAGEHDRRQVRLTVTRQGADKAEQVREIEDQLYDAIDGAVTTDDAAALTRVLGALTTGSPAGNALQKRLEAEGATAARG
ncbi:MarR family winged helix-turn-helix transcriptional regulator [Humibacter ginsenosidimutans]|uniref:MarR family transcriptional regulator n=1 Tax=Humibacter ginsenosidimutans TaxID=2599293 RepID=A0A5B8M753_9MICO|nr:MarR family transcriptional regulator [Humibacter ginsenosidimutans]QDZ16367.1 MarR family transcriptional regulator [Humibacter ginsenosidimutans]